MIRRTASWLPGWNAALLVCCLAGVASGDEDQPLRVCADPDDLPNSNQKLQGFENKIAEVIAQDLGPGISYVMKGSRCR